MDFIKSFLENIKSKLSNPFFGTLIIVIIFHHWKLWFSIFNFDSNCTLDDKLLFIQNYSEKHLSLIPFLYDVLCALIFMILGYGVVLLTRSLVMWIEYGLMPIITKRIVNKKVALRTEYDQVVKEREQFFDQYEEQRKNVRLFSQTIDQQNELIKQKDADLVSQSEAISTSIRNLDNLKLKFEKTAETNKMQSQNINLMTQANKELKKDFDFIDTELAQYRSLLLDNEDGVNYSSHDELLPKVVKKINELRRENLWGTFINVASFIENGGSLTGSEYSIIIQKGLVYDREEGYKLTPLGVCIWNFRSLYFYGEN